LLIRVLTLISHPKQITQTEGVLVAYKALRRILGPRREGIKGR
jgi:hypothetical protein